MKKEGDRGSSGSQGERMELSKPERKQLVLLAVTGTRVDWNVALNMGLVQQKQSNT